MTRPPVPALDSNIPQTQISEAYIDFDTGHGPTHTVIESPNLVKMGQSVYHRDAFTRTVPSPTSSWRPPTAWNHRTTLEHTLDIGLVATRHGLPPGQYSVITYKGHAAVNPIFLPTCVATAPDSVENNLIASALLKLQNQQVNLATNLVERKQTEELVSDVIHKIVDSVRLFKKDTPKFWKQLVHDFRHKPLLGEANAGKIPDKWLEIQYGWNPLMSDVKSAFEKIEKREADALADRVTVASGQLYGTINEILVPSSPTVNAGWRVTQVVDVQAHISLSYQMLNIPKAQFSSLGLVNPLYLVWEELPFSFVVDWFSPIGNVLNSWTAAFGWAYLGGCYSTKIGTRMSTGSVKSYDDGSTLYLPNGLFEGAGTVYARKLYRTSPVAGFYLKNPLSYLHASEALSLLVQVFR